MISSKDPINPRDELSSPLSGTLISACDEGETGSAVFIPSWDREDLVDLVPGEVAVIAFSVERQYSQGQGQRAGEEGNMATRVWDNYILMISAASSISVM